MDRAMHQRHLVEAEQHIATGDRHIARQVQLIADLEAYGYDTMVARHLLTSFRLLQLQHVDHRDRIFRELNI
jgi:hypothetical protein